jgi:hypothetical protein
LKGEHLTLKQLSLEEQHLWNSFDNSEIYEFLTGEKDTPEAPEFCWPTGVQLSQQAPVPPMTPDHKQAQPPPQQLEQQPQPQHLNEQKPEAPTPQICQKKQV